LIDVLKAVENAGLPPAGQPEEIAGIAMFLAPSKRYNGSAGLAAGARNAALGIDPGVSTFVTAFDGEGFRSMPGDMPAGYVTAYKG